MKMLKVFGTACMVVLLAVVTMMSNITGNLFAQSDTVNIEVSNDATEATKQGDIVNYTVTIQNLGAEPLIDPCLSLSFSDGLDFQKNSITVNDVKFDDVNDDSDHAPLTIPIGKDALVENGEDESKESVIQHKVFNASESEKITFSAKLSSVGVVEKIIMNLLSDNKTIRNIENTVQANAEAIDENSSIMEKSTNPALLKFATNGTTAPGIPFVTIPRDRRYSDEELARSSLPLSLAKKGAIVGYLILIPGKVTLSVNSNDFRTGAILMSQKEAIAAGLPTCYELGLNDPGIGYREVQLARDFTAADYGEKRISVGQPDFQADFSFQLSEFWYGDINYKAINKSLSVKNAKAGTAIGEISSAKANTYMTLDSLKLDNQNFTMSADGKITLKKDLPAGRYNFAIDTRCGNDAFLYKTFETVLTVNPPAIADTDLTYSTITSKFNQTTAKKGSKVGTVSSKVSGVSYAMDTDANSQKFDVDVNGNVTIKNDITALGTYDFTVIASINGDTAKTKGSITVSHVFDITDLSYQPTMKVVSINSAKSGTKIGTIASKLAGTTYTMASDIDSQNFNIDAGGNLTLKNDITNIKTYSFTINANHNGVVVPYSDSLNVVKSNPTNTIKWKVVYKDPKTGSGVIMPIDTMKKTAANPSNFDNTASSFTGTGVGNANAYLASALTDWTYNNFAIGFSMSVGNTSYSDAKGQEVLKRNAYLSNANDMGEYTKSNVYNLPYKTGETYTAGGSSYTYPARWIGIMDIAAAHGHGNIGFKSNPDPILKASDIYFGSTPNTTAIEPSCASAKNELVAINKDGALFDPYYKSAYSYRPAVYIKDLGTLKENETFALGASEEVKGWTNVPTLKDSDASLTMKDDGTLSTSKAKAGTVIGTVNSMVNGVSYTMNTDATSSLFKIDASGNISLAGDITKDGIYKFNANVTLGTDTIVLEGTLTVKTTPTHVIKWKVIYKDPISQSGVIMPVENMKNAPANSTTVDNTAASFTSKAGVNYANGYLASDLADWTYHNFAWGLSNTVSDTAFSDAKGQTLLANNPELSNIGSMVDYTKSNVYNLPFKDKESYSAGGLSFQYPASWVSASKIASSHGHMNFGISTDGDPMLYANAVYFGSTPNSTANTELLGIYKSAMYSPYYTTNYNYRPAMFIKNLGNLEENETFSLGASEESKGWNVAPEINDADVTYAGKAEIELANALTNAEVGQTSSTKSGIIYTMSAVGDSDKFSVDANGKVTLKQSITTVGEYSFTILATKGVDTVLVNGKVNIGDSPILVTDINHPATTWKCGSFTDAYAKVAAKGDYKIQFLKDYTLNAAEAASLQKFLTDKTTRYELNGVQADGKTISTLIISDQITLGGNTSAQGNLIDHIILKATNDTVMFTGENKTTFGEHITTSGMVSVRGGYNSLGAPTTSNKADLTVLSGSWDRVYSAGVDDTLQNGASLTIGGSAVVKSVSLAGANTEDNEATGYVHGTSSLILKDKASISYVYMGGAHGGAWLAVNTQGNVENVSLLVQDQASVADLRMGSFWSGASRPGKHGYISGNITINVKGDGAIKTIRGGYLSADQLKNNGGYLNGGNLDVTVEGNAVIGELYKNQYTPVQGISTLTMDGAMKEVPYVTNFNVINIGKTNKTDAKIKQINSNAATSIVADLNIMNGSTLSLGATASTIHDLQTTGAGNTLVINKAASTTPLNVTGKCTGDALALKTSGTNVKGDRLLTFNTVSDTLFTQLQSDDHKFDLAIEKNGSHIVLMDTTVLTGAITSIKQAENEHIDDAAQGPVHKDLTASFTNEDKDYIYGAFANGDATHQDAYLSTKETADAAWLKDGSIPNGVQAFTLKNTAGSWSGDAKNVEVVSGTCYYVHLRNEEGKAEVFPVDINGVHANAKAGSKPYEDGQGLKLSYELMDSSMTPAAGSYQASGIAQAAFSLNGDNLKALEDTFHANKGTADELYGIQTWSAGNAKEAYEILIPQTVLDALKASSSNIIYLYVKDTAGNTTVSSVFVGDDLMNMVVPTKAGIVAMKGNQMQVIAPILDIYNFGDQEVKVEMTLKHYSDAASKIKLVDSQAAYAANEVALSILPMQNAGFASTNVKQLDGKLFALGNPAGYLANSDAHRLSYSFDAEYDAKNIDNTLQENAFILEYHLTPVSTKP